MVVNPLTYEKTLINSISNLIFFICLGPKSHTVLNSYTVSVQELIFPITLTVENFEKLRHWEEPHLTIGFLGLAYTMIFR
jgi:hypothetical protein